MAHADPQMALTGAALGVTAIMRSPNPFFKGHAPLRAGDFSLSRNLMTTDATESLARERWSAADRAFEAYDFGTAEVEGTCGWEWDTLGTEMHRVIFLAADDRDVQAPLDRESESVRTDFVVRFKNAHSTAVLESSAITFHGGLFGVSRNSD
jgi:hypothetical protein